MIVSLGFTLITAGALVLLARWWAALFNTHELWDKTWFKRLLWIGTTAAVTMPIFGLGGDPGGAARRLRALGTRWDGRPANPKVTERTASAWPRHSRPAIPKPVLASPAGRALEEAHTLTRAARAGLFTVDAFVASTAIGEGVAPATGL